ncbi:MAG TPA: formylglycine-generating enzyme family protein [Terriglobales bacterium]|jgi:iron(II)-dependent oxidoreductase|nr:formylglycine-generating enzyme family protein [Terriglobales bacterium]
MEFNPLSQMIVIPEGFFWMGSAEGFDNEKPAHQVWVDSFAMARFPITNEEFKTFLDESHATPPPFWSDPLFSHPMQPVVGVSWFEAVAYCDWLSARARRQVRLPTEAERERAARGGRNACLYPWGNEPPSTRPHPGCNLETGGPQQVGTNPPNGFGLYDMGEGVHEWCSDYYDPAYYHDSPARNPQGPPLGQRRSSRGGSWRHKVKFSRCAARSSLPPDFQYADYGFRIAMSLV